MQCEMNIVAMAKSAERYVFVYDDNSYEALLETFAKYAQNPDLNFSHRDAALLSRKVRESAARFARIHSTTPRKA